MIGEQSADHLIFDVTARGFRQMPSLDDTMGGRVRVYESSAADAPHIWLRVIQPSNLNDRTSAPQESVVHLPVNVAWQLAEQLLHLVANHYHGFPTPIQEDDDETTPTT